MDTGHDNMFWLVLTFYRMKNKFFQNCLKLPKNYFRTIKNRPQDFWPIQRVGWVAQTNPRKFPIFKTCRVGQKTQHVGYKTHFVACKIQMVEVSGLLVKYTCKIKGSIQNNVRLKRALS